jgi:exosortase
MRKGLAAALVCGIGWLYADLGRGLGVQWAVSPDASYGAIVAIVALTILWRRRQLILNIQPSAHSLAGAFVVASGLMMYLAGLFAADLFTARASFVVVAGGLIWFLAGTSAAAAALTPLFFLLLSIPLPELVVRTLTSSLQTVAAQIAEATLATGGIPVYRDGNVLELPASTLQVVEACSGLRSVISLASVGMLLAWATSGSTTRRMLLAISTLPIAVVTNGFRVAGTGAAAEAWGPVMTRDPWHSLAGWLTFVVSLAALWSIRRALLLHRHHGHAWPEAVRT